MPAFPKYGLAADTITALAPDEVFCFGSNLRGVHGLGAAKFALEHFGAASGNGSGPQGSCYAVPTKDAAIQTLPLAVIAKHVEEALTWMESIHWKKFLFTAIGTGLAGHKSWDIARLFYVKPDGTLRREVSNVYLPKQFLAHGRMFHGEYVYRLTGWDLSNTTEAFQATKEAMLAQKLFWDSYYHQTSSCEWAGFKGWLAAAIDAVSKEHP